MQARELYQKTLDGYLHHPTKHWGNHHVNSRGMNLWMSRQGLCLRTLKSAVATTLKPSPLLAPLQSLSPTPSIPLENPEMLYGIHITFPDGTVITIKLGTPQSVNTFIDYYNLITPEPTPCFPESKHPLLPVQSLRGDTYLSCDETYYTILVDEKNSKGKGVKKGYVWETIGVNNSLVYYFYENGSRAGDVILGLLGDYRGTIQSDAYAPYKRLESDQYPDINRLACFQHVKRKFLDIGEDGDAQKIVELINRLYHQEHKHRIGQGGWTSQKHQKFR